MNGVELFLGGAVALAVLYLVVKARAGVKRAQAAADIVQVGTSPVSLFGRVLVTALVIVGAQWLVFTHSQNITLKFVALGLPALVTAYVLVKALTVIQVNPSRRAGGRR